MSLILISKKKLEAKNKKKEVKNCIYLFKKSEAEKYELCMSL